MIRERPFDSRIFERRVGELFDWSGLWEMPKSEELDAYDLVTTRLNAVNTQRIAQVQGGGFKFVGALIEMQMEVANLRTDFLWTPQPAQPSDEDEIASLANYLSFSRFHNDPKLSHMAADYYKAWIRNAVQGKVNKGVLVVKDADAVVGFVICDTDRLILICVRPDYRGQGIGRALAVGGMIVGGGATINLGTEANAPAPLNLYRSMGAKIVGTKLAFHRHTSGRAMFARNVFALGKI